MGYPDTPDAPATGELNVPSPHNITCTSYKISHIATDDVLITACPQVSARAHNPQVHTKYQSISVTLPSSNHSTNCPSLSGQQATQPTEAARITPARAWSTGDHQNTSTMDNYQSNKWSTGDPGTARPSSNTIGQGGDAPRPQGVLQRGAQQGNPSPTHNRGTLPLAAHAPPAGQQATPDTPRAAGLGQLTCPITSQLGTHDPHTATPADCDSHNPTSSIGDWGTLPGFLQRIGYPNAPGDKDQDKQPYVPDDDFDGIIPATTHKPQVGGPPTNVRRTWPFPAGVLPPHLADMYEQAIAASRAADPATRPVIKTALRLDEWEAARTGHEDDDWTLDALRYGFPIQYTGPPSYDPPLLYNHASAVAYAKTIREYIHKETAHGALFGPFESPPFTPWMVFSPLMTREKPDTKERRVIVDLSYPAGGINQYIPPHLFNGKPAAHNLPTIETAVTAINKLCPGDISMAVIDLSRAYRQFPVPPTDWPLLGIQFDGKYFCDARLPFGARLSAFAMQSVAKYIVRALGARGMTAFMYLDDIIIIEGAYETTKRHYEQTLAFLGALGLQVAPHKLQPPSSAVTWLGVHIDMCHNTLSIPDAKIAEIHKCLAAAARQPSISVRHMQSILGSINHIAKVVRAARIFISRLLAALRAAREDTIIITSAVKADLAWFIRYLHTHNARETIPHNKTVLRIWGDSSLRGGGATDGASFYTFKYPTAMAARHHITQLEAANILAAVRTFVTPSHAAGTVQIYGDNMASMSSYKSGRARDVVLAACCRAMWFHAAETQTTLEFSHMAGESMVLPDALSRASFDPRLKDKATRIVEQRALSEARMDKARFSYAAFL